MTESNGGTFSGALVDGVTPAGVLNPGSLNVAGGTLTLTGQTSTGGAVSNITGGITVQAGATLATVNAVPLMALGSGTVTLAGGTLKLQGGKGSNTNGLTAHLYNVAPVQTTVAGQNIDLDYVSLAALNTHLSNITTPTGLNTTTGGKTNFNFTNTNGNNNAPFGDTSGAVDRANYGFTSTANYETHFAGFINVTQTGLATFSTISDDGSVLFVDGVNVATVQNNFFQGMTTRTGTYNFTTTGLHAITIGFYQGGGGQGLGVNYTPAGGSADFLQNSQVFTLDGTITSTQTYLAGLTLTADSAVDISGSLDATIGPYLTGSSKLSVTSSDGTGGSYSLTTGPVTISGNSTVDVANSTGGALRHVGTGRAGWRRRQPHAHQDGTRKSRFDDGCRQCGQWHRVEHRDKEL